MKLEKEATVNEIELSIHEVEETAVIVNVNGWRIRLHKEDIKTEYRNGQIVTAKYTGDIKDIHTVRFEKIK